LEWPQARSGLPVSAVWKNCGDPLIKGDSADY
jgi:hypothetical protein